MIVHGRGKPIIVDQGTFLYSGNLQLRDHFRSTAMHNTIVIDQEEQNELEDWRMLKDRCKARCLHWKEDEKEVLFVGEHEGYQQRGATHRRTVCLIKNTHRLHVMDEILGNQENRVDGYLHLAPEIQKSEIQIRGNEALLPGVDILFEEGVALFLEEAFHSPIYGEKTSSRVIRYSMRKKASDLKLSWEIVLR
jgi:uncharacterized heparinase superfamily protein